MNSRRPKVRILAFSFVLLLTAAFWAVIRLVVVPEPNDAGPSTPRRRPSQAGELMQPQQMLEDLQYISSVIQQVHPAMTSCSVLDEFAARADATKTALHEPLPAWRFFALVNALVASLQDAHTSLWPPGGGILPVGLTWAEDGIVVSRVLDPTLPIQSGDELVSLGGRTPEQLLADLSAWIPHGNPYWVRALGSQYLGNALVLQGLGLVSRQDTGEETVRMVVRRPVARRPDSVQPRESGASQDAEISHVPQGFGTPAEPPQTSQESQAPPSQESQVPQESRIASQALMGTITAAEVPIWSGLTIARTVASTDAATGRTFSPAAEAGLRPGDRILKVDGVPVLSTDDLGRAIQECGQEGGDLTLEVLRRGQRLKFTVRPIPRRDPGSFETSYVIGVMLGGVPTSEAEKRPWFGWTIDRSAGYGLFWLDECNNTKDYRRAVDEFFAAVRKDGIQRVAIDLRRNGGGDSMVVSAFLKYLPYRNLRAPSRSTRFSPQLSQQRSFWLRSLTWIGETFFNGRWFPYPIQPRARTNQLFRGQVYVLTSWHSFSSAVDFAAILSDNHLAQVVGAPTGGTPTAYGDTLNFRTPNTGWNFSVSTTRFVRPDPARDPADALYPDVFIPTTMRDIREGRDPVLEWLRHGP